LPASYTSTGTPSVTPSASRTPDIGNCATSGDGFFCGWSVAEVDARRINITAGLPVSPCSATFYQCYSGVATPLSVVPPGTLCYANSLVHTYDPRCALTPCVGGPQSSYTPGGGCGGYVGVASSTPTPSPGSSMVPQPTVSTIPAACLYYPDGYYCASSPSELVVRSNRTAFNLTNTPCTDSFYQCVAGRTFPLQPAPPGTLCIGGQFVHPWDAQCTGQAVVNPGGGGGGGSGGGGSGGSGGGGWWVDGRNGTSRNGTGSFESCRPVGMCCERQCGRWFTQCDHGYCFPPQPVALGTLCYDWGNGPYLIHETDLRCINPFQWCAANETSVRCYNASSTPGLANQGLCTSQFYDCRNGQPYFIRDVSPGTACYNGTLIHSNAPVCFGGAVTTETTQAGGIVISNATALVAAIIQLLGVSPSQASTLSTLAAIRVALAAALGIDPRCVYITVSFDACCGGGSGGRRLAVAAPVETRELRRSRVLQTYADLPTSEWRPRTSGLAGVPVVDAAAAAGPLGSGQSVLNITLAAASTSQATAWAAALTVALTPDVVTGQSPFASQLSTSAGLSPVISVLQPGVVSAVPIRASAGPAPPAVVPGVNVAGAIAGGTVAGFVVLVAAVLLVVYWRPIRDRMGPRRGFHTDAAGNGVAMGAAPPPPGHDGAGDHDLGGADGVLVAEDGTAVPYTIAVDPATGAMFAMVDLPPAESDGHEHADGHGDAAGDPAHLDDIAVGAAEDGSPQRHTPVNVRAADLDHTPERPLSVPVDVAASRGTLRTASEGGGDAPPSRRGSGGSVAASLWGALTGKSTRRSSGGAPTTAAAPASSPSARAGGGGVVDMTASPKHRAPVGSDDHDVTADFDRDIMAMTTSAVAASPAHRRASGGSGGAPGSAPRNLSAVAPVPPSAPSAAGDFVDVDGGEF